MQKPDFSGTWTLDPASAPAAGGGGRGGGGPLGLNSKLKKPDNAVQEVTLRSWQRR